MVCGTLAGATINILVDTGCTQTIVARKMMKTGVTKKVLVGTIDEALEKAEKLKQAVPA